MSWCLLLFIFIILTVVILLLKKFFLLSSLPQLHGKHILVTGGSSGIGKATAIEASKLGANVTIIARNKTKLEDAVAEIKVAKISDKQKIQYVSLDVAKGFNAVEETIFSLEESVGPIYLLVNCAGTAICGEIDKMTESDFRYMMDLNYFGTVFPTLAVTKKMKMRKKGHIVITGSQASLLGIFGMSAYCASKFALRGFAESLHMELLPYNVSVTICLPPDTNTPGFESEEKSKPEITKKISETAGLFEPNIVGKQMLSDALKGKFFSAVGMEGFILTTLCAGMSPLSSFCDVFLQISLMSILRLVSVGYLLHFKNLIFKNVKSSLRDSSNMQKVE